MAEAAQHAHPARATLRALAAGGISLGLLLAPRPLLANAAPTPSEASDPAPETVAPEGAGDTPEGTGDSPEGTGDSPEGTGDSPEGAGDPPEGAGDSPEGAGDDPDGTGDDPDGTGDDPDGTDEDADEDAAPASTSATAEPLRPMQSAAWWTMFGAFVVGTGAGVLAGLSERQEDRATRVSTLFDSSTGAQPLYADRKDEYEQYLSRGQAYANAAIGVGVVSGLATITAITLFAIDARRQRKERAPSSTRRARVRPRLGGMEVRF